MTIPGAEPYSSIRFDYGVESDVKKGEDLDDAAKRIKEIVMELSDEEYDRIKASV